MIYMMLKARSAQEGGRAAGGISKFCFAMRVSMLGVLSPG